MLIVWVFHNKPPITCRFPDSPRRTRRATFTAPGSPEIGIPPPELPLGLSAVRPSPSSPPTSGRLRLAALRPVNLLVPFALWPALPTSDYYGTSDASQVSLPDCWGHPFRGSLPRSRRWTLRGSLGGGYPLQPIRSSRLPTGGRVVQVFLPLPLNWKTFVSSFGGSKE